MSWSVDIAHNNLPDPDEPIVSFCSCDGNFLRAIYFKTSISPSLWTREFAIEQLQWFISEIDKGDCGDFNDSWCVESDQKWSKGRESQESYNEFRDFIKLSYQQWTGIEKRRDMRNVAMRFLLYYIAGYNIEFIW
jgi:hypothetical protein